MRHVFNNRILVIDDDETIRDSFRDILVPKRRDSYSLDRASEVLFGKGTARDRKEENSFRFELSVAANGIEGFEMVKEAIEKEQPFAAIFVDMRMPGWDGLETVQRIRDVDERAEIIFVTAYSDYGIEEVVARAGMNVSYHCKPFSVEEVRQIATKAVYEWNKARSLEDLIEITSHLRASRWQLKPLLNNILQQVADMLGTLSAMLVVQNSKGFFDKVISIGALAETGSENEYILELEKTGFPERMTHYAERFLFFQLGRYGIVALLQDGVRSINIERIYLVRLFLEQAALTIANVDLQETLIRNEKLSAVGKAIGMVAHDLRGPIGSICSATSMAAEMADDPDAVKEIHRLIDEQAAAALALVEDILDFTHNAELTKDTILMGPFVESVARSVAENLRELSVPMKVEMDSDTPFPADERKIFRVMVNLIRNAAEAVEKRKPDAPSILLKVTDGEEGKVRFEVSDNGGGIAEEIREHLFVPFSTYGKSKGTGLGLAIVKQFTEAHGGEVSVSTSPAGTRFTVELPRS